MIPTTDDVALLAPVPLEHLQDGAMVCAERGRVAYGSRAFETFLQLESLRKDQPVDVYIYASHAEPAGAPTATWHARYLGFVKSKHGAHPEGEKYRPPSTFKYPDDNNGWWAIFWEIERLRELPQEEQILVRKFFGLGRKTPYKKTFVPEGPLLGPVNN
jgi:hypothetical protein